MFKMKRLHKRAQKLHKTIVFPEAGFSARTLEAAKIIAKKGIAKPILIGDESAIILADKKLDKFQIINPQTFAGTAALAKALHAKRKDKGMTSEEANKLILDPYYFACMLVEEGYADGMVGGAESSTARTVRPALQIIKGERKNKIVSSCFLLYGGKFLKDKTLLVGDCAINVSPSADDLCTIAWQTLESYCQLGIDQFAKPKIAFLSYSSHGSAKSDEVDKAKKAADKFKKESKNLDLLVDGELQLDAALVPRVAAHKCADSPLNGDANILILPELNSGNISVKAMQYFGDLKAVGPILQGLKKPVNDLSRGCSVEDIVDLTAITAIQADNRDKKAQNKEEK